MKTKVFMLAVVAGWMVQAGPGIHAEPAKDDAKLSFTVHGMSIEEGEPARPYLLKGEKKIGFRQMSNCNAWGDSGGLRVMMEPCPSTTLAVQPSPVGAAVPFTGEGFGSYVDFVTNLAGVRTKVVGTSAAYRVLGWKGHTLRAKYAMDGREWVLEVTFLNVGPEEQIAIVLKTPAEESQQASAIAAAFLGSWHEMDESRDRSET